MDKFRKGGNKFNSNLAATNRLFAKNPLLKKRKKRAPGIYDPNAKYRFDDGGYIEADLTPKEIQAYRDGGYIVEDISIPSLSHMQEGGELCPKGQMWDEATQSCVSANETTTEEVGFDPIDMWAQDYEEKNPRGNYVYDKKQQYLKRHKGLNKAAGVTLDNFPKEVEDQINEKYNYNMNGYITDRMAKVKKFNPKKRDEWVDELGPRSREVVADSKYGSKLQPSLWSRSLAGLATLASPFSPDLQAEVKASLPGLTKKETNEIYNANYKGIPLGGLETFSAADIPGAVIANYLKNSKKDNPNIFSGELMSNVDAVDAMAMNPIGVIGGIEGLAALGTKGVSLLGLTADALKPGAKALDPTFIPEQTFKKEFSNIYNPKTKTYDVYDINVPQEAIPGRSYADVQHKIKNLRKDLNINPVENFIRKKFRTNAEISLDKDAGMVIDPETGKLFDSNTRYWLNREYGIFPKAPINKTQLAKSNGTLIKKGLTFDESEELLSKLNNSTTVTEPFEIAKKRIVNSSNNINRIIRKPDPVVKPNYGQQEFAFPIDAPIPSARLSNEEQMIEGMERARLAKNEEGTALNPSVGVDKPRVIKSPDYYLDIMKMNKYNGKNKQYFIDLVESVKKQGNVASERQYDELQRILSGDYTRDKRGYAKVPTKLPGSPNSFKSEINWETWNTEIPKNKSLMQEYNAIEETSKANGTWMKNSDGTPFNGTPEQFVQQNSENFKNAFGNNYVTGYHGSNRGDIQEFREGKVRKLNDGVYLADSPKDADTYRLKLNPFSKRYELAAKTENPLTFDAKNNFWTELDHNELVNKIGQENFNALGIKPKKKYDTAEVTDIAKKLGYDAVNFENIKDVGAQSLLNGDILRALRSPVNKNNYSIINPKNIKSLIGNNGMFDMTNPNIYKSVLPIGLGLGATQYKQGGPIEMDLTEDEINSYKEGGWIVEEID